MKCGLLKWELMLPLCKGVTGAGVIVIFMLDSVGGNYDSGYVWLPGSHVKKITSTESTADTECLAFHSSSVGGHMK